MDLTQLIITIITISVIVGALQGACAFLIYVERKISAYVQDRIGPNRVGPWGLLQSVADGLKFLFKEDIIPAHVDKVLFLLAPAVSLTTATLAFAVVPFGPTMPVPRAPLAPAPLTANATAAERQQFDDAMVSYKRGMDTYDVELKAYRDTYQFVIAPGVDIGILFVFAIGSLTVYGIILGGWAANNKYSFLGALRSSAQIISYEIPMGMAILSIILVSGSLNLERIINYQVGNTGTGWHTWNVFYQPLAFLLFMISSFAETNRLPFDLPEAEQELIGGWHTEYSALKFGLFFLGEYTAVITASFLLSITFFGGWHFPFIAEQDSFWLIKLIVILVKVTFFILFIMLIRWTLPRFRFDQLMGLAWKVLIPMAVLNLVCLMFVKEFGLSEWFMLPISIVLIVGTGWVALQLPAPTPERKPASLAHHVGGPRDRVAMS